jgi:arylsulfatase A-like enzyme
MMDTAPASTMPRNRSIRARLSPANALLLAIWLGLCGGYLDLSIIIVKKLFMNKEGWYRTGRDFPWTVPVGHVVLLMLAGIVVAAASWLCPKGMSLRAGSWILATLALWGAFLRSPFYGGASLLLAIWLGLLISDALVAYDFSFRSGWVRKSLAGLLGLLILLFASSTGRQIIRESRGVTGLPALRSDVPNILFIVLDTVRASSTSLYNYPRDTTPNLKRWAQKGVRFNRSLATAPWTFPSHSSFFTGQWPFKINSQWKSVLDTPDSTLAEFLTSQGYQTAGFVANTSFCNYETGLDRGFNHYEDYALTPRSFLSRTVHGKWILQQILSVVDRYEWKWVELQSKGAHELNDNVLGWLSKRRPDRPFFAFLNYFDAHEPYLAPSEYRGRFGIRPTTTGDHQFLIDYLETNKATMNPHDSTMARDSYDDCLAFLDGQVGRLLDELESRGTLENTVVVITSDHGEAFGDHGSFLHSYSVFLEEVCVPLVILGPGLPVGRSVYGEVSLRDLPATVTDLVGLGKDSPFPGRSLADHWRVSSGELPTEPTSPALSERISETEFHSQVVASRDSHEIQMSLVALGGYQYIRAGMGDELLFNLWSDPGTQTNLTGTPNGDEVVRRFRRILLKTLTENQGTEDVENAYMRMYRQRLANVVRETDEKRVAAVP